MSGDGTKLEIRESLIPDAGLGLFTCEKIIKSTTICVYSGTIISLLDVLRKEDRSYIMGGFGYGRGHIDATDHPQVAARYINDNLDPHAINARFVKDRDRMVAHVVALRDIEKGEEIYASYGQGFWRYKEKRSQSHRRNKP